ncbi:hypothetical protein [Natronorubrum sp. A-ect3]|uniref:hypothetical protein n=1 Tax=Natronorubrum sp. A-ect3 TaxID=3242698 RepID=UPI00359EB352
MTDALARHLDIESEDDLTRIVFGLLDLLGPTVLSQVLELSDDELSREVQVDFHTRIDPRAERVPDVVISDADTMVMIEAKRGTDFDPEQLQDEHEDLRQFGNERKQLLLVTGHKARPSQLDSLDLEYVEWLSWRDIALRVSKCDRSTLSETKTQLITLLRTKLEEEGYMPFTGFSEQLLDEFSQIRRLSERYYKNVARFHRDIEGRLGERGLKAKNMWRDGVSQDFNRFPADLRFVSSNLWIAYGEPDFAINNKNQHYLFVAFCIDTGETPLIRVGYSMSPKQNTANREALINNADEIVQFVVETDSQLLQTDRNFHIVEQFSDESEANSILNSADRLSYMDRVQIVIEYDSSRLSDPELTELVADDLVMLHEFTHPRLYP